MPQPQLGAASHPQLGATSHPQLGAAKQPRRPLKRLFNPPKILQRGAHGSQLGAAISQPQLGAASQQLGAGAAQQLGAAISQPQLGATSQPQLGALKHDPKLLSLPRSLLNKPGRAHGSQTGATSQPQLGAATSQPQLGAESQQPPKRPAFAFDGANAKAATANRARKRTDILVSPKI